MEAAGASIDSHSRHGRWFVVAVLAAAAIAVCAPAARAMPLPGDPLAASGSAPAIQNEFSQPTSAGAVVRADINSEGSDTQYYIQYGPGMDYGSVVPASPADIGSGTSFVRVSQAILNLKPLHTYHWRVVATNSGGTTEGMDQVFATPPPTPQGAPTASTGHATDVTTTSATLNGTVNPNNGETVYHFEYGTSTAYGTSVPSPDAPVGDDTANHAVSQKLSGLKPGTTYHFRVVASNIDGTSNGPDETFTTLAPPVAVTGTATAIGRTGATLNATVNPSGSATTYHFQYGTTSGYGATAPAPDGSAGSDNVAHPEQVAITGLAPNKTYHFRIVATSAGGTSNGADRTFKTARKGTPPAPPAVAASVTRVSITPNKFKLSGRIVNHRCVVATRRNQTHNTCTRTIAPRVAFHLNLAASVKFVVQRILGGRLVGKRCVAATRSNRGRRACFRAVNVRGSFTRKTSAGTHKFTWNGRIGGHALGAGWYYLRAIPTAKGHPSKQGGALFLLGP
jgi:hypothetical protein